MTKRILKNAKRCLVRGAGSVIDMGATLHKRSGSNASGQSDFEAIKKDWEITGKDLSSAITAYQGHRYVQK
ncbi:MAG: hypothetical protein JW837_16440 [Sedimentisphaerales bacterium]|nr:hypothetical protein [Sedimentisphaerales bacterium]